MEKRIVLVTGSSIGLGSEIIKKYASNGFNVVINYLSHEKEAFELMNEVSLKYGIEALCIKADISNEEEINKMKDEIINKFGKIDVLINNASISRDNDFNLKTKNDFMRVLEVNLVGTFLVSRTFGNLMYEKKSGKIINISSTNGIDTYYEYGLDYDASKSGVINLTHNLANHYSPYVNVNCVCPGWIDTPMNKDMDIEFRKCEEEKILLNRFAKTDEIASLVYFLGSDEADYINDSIIRIDGGKKC